MLCVCRALVFMRVYVRIQSNWPGGGKEEETDDDDDDDVQSRSKDGGNEASSVTQSGFKSCPVPSPRWLPKSAQTALPFHPFQPPPFSLCPKTMHTSLIPPAPSSILCTL